MTEFNSTSKFRVTMVHSDGTTDRVSAQIGLDGLKVTDANTGRALRSYELSHISRWQSRGNSLILYTRTPVDVEERQLTLQGDEHTIRSALDVLTCSCMQLAELLQSKQSNDAQETANSLHALVASDGKKKSSTKLPSADDVEYWTAPAMEGWLQSQGDHIKSWRKRWFVLKQGYLFRFMNSTVTESTKPRGVVDLSKIQDVSQATKVTNRPMSFQLKTSSGGSVCYLCENETELVMWMSAINREVERIVKKLAGVEDEPAPKPTTTSKASSKASTAAAGGGGSGGTGSGGAPSEWMRQLEKNFDNMSTSQPTSSSRSNNYGGGPAMVDVVGYEAVGGGRSGGGGAGGQRGGGGSSYQAPSSQRDYGSAYGNNNSGLDYGNIAGAAGVGGGGLSADTLLNYGSGGADRAASRPSAYSPGPGAGAGYGSGGSAGYGGGGSAGAGYGSSGAAGAGYGNSDTGYGAGNGYGSGNSGAAGYGGAGNQGAGAYGSSGNGYGASGAGGAYGQAAQPASQYAQPAQQQQQPAMSLIDQVPQSQPAYPYYQQGMAPQATPTSQQSQWQVHHTAEGRPYYYNASTGTTQWEPPAGM